MQRVNLPAFPLYHLFSQSVFENSRDLHSPLCERFIPYSADAVHSVEAWMSSHIQNIASSTVPAVIRATPAAAFLPSLRISPAALSRP